MKYDIKKSDWSKYKPVGTMTMAFVAEDGTHVVDEGPAYDIDPFAIMCREYARKRAAARRKAAKLAKAKTAPSKSARRKAA